MDTSPHEETQPPWKVLPGLSWLGQGTWALDAILWVWTSKLFQSELETPLWKSIHLLNSVCLCQFCRSEKLNSEQTCEEMTPNLCLVNLDFSPPQRDKVGVSPRKFQRLHQGYRNLLILSPEQFGFCLFTHCESSHNFVQRKCSIGFLCLSLKTTK